MFALSWVNWYSYKFRQIYLVLIHFTTRAIDDRWRHQRESQVVDSLRPWGRLPPLARCEYFRGWMYCDTTNVMIVKNMKTFSKLSFLVIKDEYLPILFFIPFLCLWTLRYLETVCITICRTVKLSFQQIGKQNTPWTQNATKSSDSYVIS